MNKQEQVKKLMALLESDSDLKQGLEISIQRAGLLSIGTLDAFYDFLDGILTHIPMEKELMPTVREFYFVLSHSPNDILKTNEAFNAWINEFVKTRGDFMDTTESAHTLESFIANPDYKIDDYIKGPSGWLTFNQFLARELKPGKRPVAGLCDDSIVVSPADSEFEGQWPISDNATITVKGINYSVTDLLGDSAFKQRFDGGVFTHSFLAITDYHRFHMPVSGTIREVRIVPGRTWVTEKKKPDGTVENIDEVGFQFTHTRGYIMIDSPVGMVAVMPVGMGHISSVVINAVEGDSLAKGDEFGYFAFGGSDIIMLFEPGQIELIAKEKQYCKKGEQIAFAVNKRRCNDK
jgi:phosphatidylserine decarboxylase